MKDWPKVETPEQLEEELTKMQCSATKKTEVAEFHFLGDQLQILFPRNRMALTENGKTRTVNNLKELLQFLAVLCQSHKYCQGQTRET